MTDQKLVDELEKALRDEAYDGGFGYMGDEQFPAYVRALAETAAEVVEKAHTSADDDRTSEEQEEQRHGGRDADHEEQQTDDRAATGRLGVGGGHASMMPQAASDGKRVISHTPTDDDRGWAEYRDAFPENNTPDQKRAYFAGFRRSEVPEPSTEDWADRIRAAREKAIAKGYTPEHDAKHGIRHLLRWAIEYARRGKAEDSSGLMAAALELAEIASGELERLRHVADTMSAVSEALRTRYASDSQAAYFMRQIDAALLAVPKSQGEPSDAGVGWFEWFKMPENTTEIAYVHESGEVFDPVRGWNPVEFTIAAAEGRVHRLVRAGGVR